MQIRQNIKICKEIVNILIAVKKSLTNLTAVKKLTSVNDTRKRNQFFTAIFNLFPHLAFC